MFCELCKTHYSTSLVHKCGEYFCKKCLKSHNKSMFCSTSIKLYKRQIKETIFIVDLKICTENYKVISLCEFINEQEINIYYFYSNKSFYKKITVNITNIEIEKSEVFECH